ncbi:hypothetical protein [Pseudoalteromonas sp. SCQQ13]|uniref:hypothetical protein n=1 Tax=Pseudoalteromonas sp. SCQQ13 TaxID=2792066 RepID=UPI0018CDB7AA|nr:hypothetical protein [Pseudoalteromonas sp. SCQQ13]MBH0093339.1 hypothetical protein [Pseudoalteromonas sp. SCQQ13]
MSNLDKFVADYINNFESSVESYEQFKNGYISNIENRVTEVTYSRVTPENFVEKAAEQRIECTNPNYGEVLTHKIMITLKHALNNFLFVDLKTMFEQGYEIDEATSRYLQLKRPEALFKGLEEEIKAKYKVYADAEYTHQRNSYLEMAKIEKYVSMREAEAKALEIKAKQTALIDTVNKLTLSESSSVEHAIDAMIADLETVTTAHIREKLNLTSEDISDKAISDVLKLSGFTKKRTSTGNVWNKSAQ